MDIPNLQQKLAYELSANNIKSINKLKFQNCIYQPGDDIQLRTDINSTHCLYAKILSIIQAKNITNFPLVYVVWYEKINQTRQQNHYETSRKELILTVNKDWQYIEAVKGKIKVLSEKQFIVLDPKEQENETLFYCHSYLRNNQLMSDTRPFCYCQTNERMDKLVSVCQICGVLSHVSCNGNKEGRCIRCSN